MRKLLLALVVLVGCKGTEPHRFGALKSKVTDGRVQPSVTAGVVASDAVNLSYREQIALVPTWQRVILPRMAYAQGTSSIQVQPGAIACVREDQMDLIPKTRCVTADQQGNSHFDWLTTPTRAGSYVARISSTYGLEATQVDSVTVTIVAGVVDPNLTQNWGSQSPPAELSPTAASDQYGNKLPYRIDAGVDTVLKVKGDTVGTLAARTVTFTGAFLDTLSTAYPQAWHGPLSIRGVGDTLRARLWYHIGGTVAQPTVSFRVRGLNLTGP